MASKLNAYAWCFINAQDEYEEFSFSANRTIEHKFQDRILRGETRGTRAAKYEQQQQQQYDGLNADSATSFIVQNHAQQLRVDLDQMRAAPANGNAQSPSASSSFQIVRAEHLQVFQRPVWSQFSHALAAWVPFEHALNREVESRYRRYVTASSSMFACFDSDGGKGTGNGRVCKLATFDDTLQVDFATMTMKSAQRKGCSEVSFLRREVLAKTVRSPNLTPAGDNEAVQWRYYEKTPAQNKGDGAAPRSMLFTQDMATTIEANFQQYLDSRRTQNRVCKISVMDATTIVINFDTMTMTVQNLESKEEHDVSRDKTVNGKTQTQLHKKRDTRTNAQGEAQDTAQGAIIVGEDQNNNANQEKGM